MWGVILFISATLVFSLLINIAFGHRSYWRAKRLRQQRDASSVCGACTSPTSQSSQSRGPAEGPLLSALSPRAAAQYFMDHGLPSHLVASQLLPFLTPYEVTVVAQVNRFFRNVTSPLAPYWAEALDRLPPIDGAVPVANRPRRVSRRYYFQRVAQYPYELCGGHMSAASCRVVIAAKVYDVTDFLAQHPGGDQILLDYSGGRDATTVFHLSFHSDAALALMGRYLLWDRDQVLGRAGTLLSALQDDDAEEEEQEGAAAAGAQPSAMAGRGWQRSQQKHRRSVGRRGAMLRFDTVQDARQVLGQWPASLLLHEHYWPALLARPIHRLWALVRAQ